MLVFFKWLSSQISVLFLLANFDISLSFARSNTGMLVYASRPENPIFNAALI